MGNSQEQGHDKLSQTSRLHTEAIEAVLDYIGLVADSSNLTLDPDLDSYYVMDAITARAPRLQRQRGNCGRFGRHRFPGRHQR